jgi:hypothetical protein
MSARDREPRRRRIAACTVAVMGVLLATGSRPASTAGAEGMPVPEPGVCAGCKPPLTYHGGPVMATSALTVTPVYWAPSGYTFPDNYATIVNQ